VKARAATFGVVGVVLGLAVSLVLVGIVALSSVEQLLLAVALSVLGWVVASRMAA
jgi:hypothetical protein